MLENCPEYCKIFNQTFKKVVLTTYQQMSLLSFGHDPLRCIVCGSQLVRSGLVAGKTIAQFLDCHMQLATRKRMPL